MYCVWRVFVLRVVCIGSVVCVGRIGCVVCLWCGMLCILYVVCCLGGSGNWSSRSGPHKSQSGLGYRHGLNPVVDRKEES